MKLSLSFLLNFFQLGRPEVVVNRFPENQHTFQKKCTVPGDKTYKETATEKTNTTPTPMMLLFSEIILSVLAEVSNPNLIRL